MYPVFVTPLVPSSLRTTNVTVYVPGLSNVTPGFCTLESVPLPKSQFQNLGLPVVRSLKYTPKGAQPDVGDVAVKSGDMGWAKPCRENKSATGKSHVLNRGSRFTNANRTGISNRLPQGASTNLLKCKTVLWLLGGKTPQLN